MKNQHSNHLLLLTLATLFISTSGTLGRFIDLPTSIIIWWRAALAALFLFIFSKYKKTNLKIHSRKDFFIILLSSLFLAAHWVTYFYALKLSNVALGMLSMFTFPIITTFLEPLFTNSKLSSIHIFLGALVLLGIYILAPSFDFESAHLKGIIFGVFSAFCYATRNLMLKKPAANYDGTSLMLFQTVIVTIVLFPVLFMKDLSNLSNQFPYLILLGLLTTAIGHSLFISSLKYFSVSTASIIGSTQPIFGIIIAFIFLGETPTLNTFIGGSLILITVIVESIRSRKENN
ncbi:multidrug transporter [Pseudalgibacter alginicilyticus]|uniref:Multidrug transporter n=1 Tax=Pseudalgibacter alginicilyticus TaxID=1736674 RepID=A0A0P0CT01_9FLAO|nr:EamA family transporter [Pseudalgibacter alginicilyticus]ALJ05963.1 multidrug transporter [Pseudalgibacter alginicilyticus]